MLKTIPRKFYFKRREFLKTTALAGMAIALPGITGFSQDQDAINSSYERLADSLNKLPNSFPRTKSNIEITLLKKIFLPKEAKLAGQLTIAREPVDAIAKRVGLSSEETAGRLKNMLERGFVWGDANKGDACNCRRK